MLSPSAFRAIVSGERRGPSAAVLRAALRLVEFPYTWAVRRRNRGYDDGITPTERVAVPVVSVGNLTLGGTGKTPLVEWVARWFRQHDVRVTIVSRGYGADQDARNDEALELEQKLPDVPHLQNPDRVAAARTAIEEFDCQLVLLDDGFQHRRLARDLDIVLVDALEPFGFGHVFPRGTLREPLEGLRRAQVVALSRADVVSPERRQEIRDALLPHAPTADWLELTHAPQQLLSSRGELAELGSLSGQSVAAFAGIGNPAGFQHTLAACGCDVVAWREFADHHKYTRADVEELARWSAESGSTALVCTHKDLVKLGVDRLGQLPLWALSIEMRFLVGREILERRLAELVAAAIARTPSAG